ncbi:MAG: hypothetical protein BM558_13625 [Roseobacter sp. MedPE-SW]|nr:MAG: hypothetical protein BM558_13625 [Roseobacter sp. MedPE-SW]
MNLDMILKMVMRRLLGKAVNAGVDAGLGALSGRKPRGSGHEHPQGPAVETPAEAEARAERDRIRAIRQARRAKRDQQDQG